MASTARDHLDDPAAFDALADVVGIARDDRSRFIALAREAGIRPERAVSLMAAGQKGRLQSVERRLGRIEHHLETSSRS